MKTHLTLSLLLGLLCLVGLSCGTSTGEHPSEIGATEQTRSDRSTSVSPAPEGQWTSTGRMANGRILHTATLLADGQLLATGGYNRSTELYDSATGTWSRTVDALNTHRAATATLLPNGQVLIAGLGGAEWNSGISAELYDSAAHTWTATGNLATPRLYHTATLLPGGRVLVTGGASSEYGGAVLSTAEVYDFATGTWTSTGLMTTARRNHTATLLDNGKVLVTGGTNASGLLQNSAEVYDATTGIWSPVGSLAVARAYHSATLLPSGKVLVAGGGGSDWSSSASAELFDPDTGTWTPAASMARPRRFHSATQLPSGLVLVTGGFHEYDGILTAAEVYDFRHDAWRSAGNLATGRYLHTATPLTGGRVLVAGGFSNGDQASTEVYTPAESSPTPELPSEPTGTSVLLQVVTASGNPIPGAAISSQGALFPVDSSGHRLFENLQPGRFFARVDALGFTSATAVVEVNAGAHVGARVQLLPLANPIPFQAELGGLIQTADVRVTIPPDAVVDALGQPVAGTVNVTIAPLDPTSQLAAMPGPLEGTASTNGETVQLESLFMAEVSLWSNGAPVQLAPGNLATLEFLLPESLSPQLQAGDTVPAWWFDLDAGHWRQEGTGTVQPSSSQPGRLAWAVQVQHFTWWNSDFPWTQKSCVNVLVLDEFGDPVAGAPVSAEGVSYTGISYTQYTDASGHVCIEVKLGNTANVYVGLLGQPTTATATVTGTQSAAVCGTGPCTSVTLHLGDFICTPGAYKQCPYSGPAETESQGLCRAGRQQCDVVGTAWSACQGEVLPAAENCQSPFDDNCDGTVNEGCFCSNLQGQPCYGGPPGTLGVGNCHGGTVGCDLFGTVSCLGEQRPQADACWTLADEDCDGVSEACASEPSGWASTASMVTPRYYFSATVLPNGKVLVSGGHNDTSGFLTAAELYNPATGTWSATGSMAWRRQNHQATLLPNGKVLVSGGLGDSGFTSTAEVYDPVSGTWSATASMASPRHGHTATLLPDGKVLVSGGNNGSIDLATAEVYDPASGTWSATGSMASPRERYTATLLPNGKVLVSGGNNGGVLLTTAEVYDPALGTWSATGSMASARFRHTATLLPNGQVLVTGGSVSYNSAYSLAEVEVYDPVSGTWSATGAMASPRAVHTATLLPNGKVLVTGGLYLGLLGTAEIYDPASGIWSAIGSMASPLYAHSAVLLPDGKVLVSGGYGMGYSAGAELYTP